MEFDFRKTGELWKNSNRSRSQIVRRVCETLEREYSQPRLGNPYNPVDDLVYIIISNKTAPQTAIKTYMKIKNIYSNWYELINESRTKLEKLLIPAGLASVKSQQIFNALTKIEKDFGQFNLASLANQPVNKTQYYLKTLSGVSDKVAKCVMMFTLGFEVLPVDTHVHRIALRLGWTARKRADQSHNELEGLIPPKRRYAFHVDCIVHGRKICRSQKPQCKHCCINRYCRYNKI